MALRTQRFGVRNAAGARSSEWFVAWKTNTSDVYIATRGFDGVMKVSLHESGRCHVRAPGSDAWRGAGPPPAFLQAWHIDPASTYEFPFALVFPEQELRPGPWRAHKDKGTVWLEAEPGKGVEVATFLVRADGDMSSDLLRAGWTGTIVDQRLPDSRRLVVAVAKVAPPQANLAELPGFKARAATLLQELKSPPGNPRLLLVAGPNELGTRKFVEIAAR